MPWLGGERGMEVVEDGAAVRLGGADDGAERGVGLRAPFGTEAVRDFAEDHARAQRALGDVVGGRHIAVSNEHEQMPSIARDAPAQPLGRLATTRQSEHAVQPAIQIGAILGQRGVAQRVSPSPDGDRAQEQPSQRRGEAFVAAIDGVLRIA